MRLHSPVDLTGNLGDDWEVCAIKTSKAKINNSDNGICLVKNSDMTRRQSTKHCFFISYSSRTQSRRKGAAQLTRYIINDISKLLKLWYRGRNSTTSEEVSRFQRLFPNPSWLVWGKASRHQNLAPTFPRIDNCLIVQVLNRVEVSWICGRKSRCFENECDWSHFEHSGEGSSWEKLDVRTR